MPHLHKQKPDNDLELCPTAVHNSPLLTGLLQATPKDKQGRIEGTHIPHDEIEKLNFVHKEDLVKAIETICAISHTLISDQEKTDKQRERAYLLYKDTLEEAYGVLIIIAYLDEKIEINELNDLSIWELVDNPDLAKSVIKILSSKENLSLDEQKYMLLAHLGVPCLLALRRAEDLRLIFDPVGSNVATLKSAVNGTVEIQA